MCIECATRLSRLSYRADVLSSLIWLFKEIYMPHITGNFNVTLTPQAAAPGIEAAQLGRQTLDKQFHGDLEAHSLGEMLASISPVQGSAGYVAIERVNGTLQGKQGAFVLMHTGTMNRGERQLTVQVVPDSGTGELTGLSGLMDIQITNGQHGYSFDYTLPEAAKP
jgi:hypothetical protein